MHKVFSGKVICYLLFWIVIEISAAPLLSLGPFRPLFSYLMILYAAFQWGASQAVTMAFLVGIFRDLAGVYPFGLETVVLVLTSTLLEFLVPKIERQYLLMRIVITFTFVFFTLTMVWAAGAFLGFDTGSVYEAMLIFFGSAFYTAALMPLFFHLSGQWFSEPRPLKQYELFGR